MQQDYLICPLCQNHLTIMSETDFDSYKTMYYPHCDNCDWRSHGDFNNEQDIKTAFYKMYNKPWEMVCYEQAIAMKNKIKELKEYNKNIILENLNKILEQLHLIYPSWF